MARSWRTLCKSSAARNVVSRPGDGAPIRPGLACGTEASQDAFQPGLDLGPLLLVGAQPLDERLIRALGLRESKGERLALVLDLRITSENGLRALSTHDRHGRDGSRVV